MTGSYEVQTWSPAQLGAVVRCYLQRLGALYRTDKALVWPVEAAVRSRTWSAKSRWLGAAPPGAGLDPLSGLRRASFGQMMALTSGAAMEFGWDTHCEPGSRRRALDRCSRSSPRG